MASAKVSRLTRQEIARAASRFEWRRQMPKWTVVVDGKELPARPLVLDAAGVPPNDPTNSHQAVAILQDRGFAIHYEGKAVAAADSKLAPPSVSDEFIRSLRGCGKGPNSLVEAREREHWLEDDKISK
jgi:hypothetical protein